MARLDGRPRERRRPAVPRRLVVGALAGVLLALAVSAGADGSAVSPPRLSYTLSTLPNGLRVIVHEDHSTPIVNVQVWYHAGAKDERTGRAGVAHLLEHLMFLGSKNVGPGRHAAIVAGLGGRSNALTTEDVTVFWNTVPSSDLPTALWLEADRMASLRLDRTVFQREREVVKEERRTRVENQPYGRLPEIVLAQAFKVHPYRHATTGSLDELDAASMDDLRGFYRTYYVPWNATLVVAGDVDSGQAAGLAAKYFGRIPGPGKPVPRDIPAESPAAGPRRVTVGEPWPLPVVVAVHHAPPDGHPDSYALQAAAKILADGQNSRLYLRLVYDSGIALSASAVSDPMEHPGLFYAFAIVQPGHSALEAELSIAWELDRLRREPVTAQEIDRVRSQFTRDQVFGRETVQQKASALGHASVLHGGDVSAVDTEFDRLRAVTAEDIQRAARTYLGTERRLLVTVLPTAAPGGAR